MPAAPAIGRGQTARERLEERVGAGIVVARRQVDVLACAGAPRARPSRAGRRRGRARTPSARARRTSARSGCGRDCGRARRVCLRPCAGCPTSSSRPAWPSVPRAARGSREDGRSPGRRRSGSRPGRAARARARDASRARTATGGSSRTRVRRSRSRSMRLSRRRTLGTRRSGRRRGAPCARRAPRTAAGARRRS